MAGTRGLVLEDCMGPQLGAGSATRALGVSPGVKEP